MRRDQEPGTSFWQLSEETNQSLRHLFGHFALSKRRNIFVPALSRSHKVEPHQQVLEFHPIDQVPTRFSSESPQQLHIWQPLEHPQPIPIHTPLRMPPSPAPSDATVVPPRLVVLIKQIIISRVTLCNVPRLTRYLQAKHGNNFKIGNRFFGVGRESHLEIYVPEPLTAHECYMYLWNPLLCLAMAPYGAVYPSAGLSLKPWNIAAHRGTC